MARIVNSQFIVSVIVSAVGVFFALQAAQLSSSIAQVFPLTVSIAIAVLGVFEAISSVFGQKNSSSVEFALAPEIMTWSWLFASIGSIFLFGMCLGVFVATYIYFQFISRIAFWKRCVVSATFSVSLYFVFGILFHFPLPEGIALPYLD